MSEKPPPSVRFVIVESPGKEVPITSRVLAEFEDVGLPAAAPVFPFGRDVVEPPPQRASEVATPDQVAKLISEKDQWELAITVGSEVYVVSKKALEQIVSGPSSAGAVTFYSLPARASDRLLVAWGSKMFGPESSWERIKGGLDLPVAKAALIASAAGLFGLAQYREDLVRPKALGWAVVLSGVALLISLFATNTLRTFWFEPSRLDELRKWYHRAIARGVKASNGALVLLIVAILVAFVSVWPPKAKSVPAAGISWAVQRGAEGVHSVIVDVTWKGLEEKVSRVQTTIKAGDALIGTASNPRGSDGNASTKLEVVADSGQLDVDTRALDKAGAVVGDAVTEAISVP